MASEGGLCEVAEESHCPATCSSSSCSSWNDGSRWSELPLDVLCSVVANLPLKEQLADDKPPVAVAGVLRLVCRDWCSVLDTSITSLQFGPDWPNLNKVVTHFPNLKSIDFSLCDFKTRHVGVPTYASLSCTNSCVGDALMGEQGVIGGMIDPLFDSMHALLPALQLLVELKALEVLKLGYAVIKLLQPAGGEREVDDVSSFGASGSKESPVHSPVSRLLSRLQQSSRGNVMGNMDRMDGLEVNLSPRATQPTSPVHSDTQTSDQERLLKRAGSGSRLRIMTGREQHGNISTRKVEWLGHAEGMVSSPVRTPPAGCFCTPAASMEHFIKLLEQLPHLQELHILLGEAENMAVYKKTVLGYRNMTPVSNDGLEPCTPTAGQNAPCTPPAGLQAPFSPFGSVYSPRHPFNAAFFTNPGPFMPHFTSPSTPSVVRVIDPLAASPSTSSDATNSISSPCPLPVPPLSGRSGLEAAAGMLHMPAGSGLEASLYGVEPMKQMQYPLPTPPPSSPIHPYGPSSPFLSSHASSVTPALLHAFSPSPSSCTLSPMDKGQDAGNWVQLGRKLQLPTHLGQLHLTFLCLRSHNLQVLPATVGALGVLSQLHLPANGLANLPHAMSRLQQLKALDVSDNRLRSSGLLLALSSLTPLQHLNLHRNRLLDTSFLLALTQLQSLDLSSNKLKTLTYLRNMPYLLTLDLSNNHLSMLPEELSTLTALEVLDVRRNRLSTLPSKLGHLMGLMYLNASHNYIRSVDPAMLQSLGKLHTLNLADNCLREVPESIGGCVQLAHLNLSCNQLDSLPTSVSMLTQLSSLMLNSNEVEEVMLVNLPLLSNVEICDNFLLRATIMRLPSLEQLKLSGNYLPRVRLGPFPKLRHLHLSANHLEQVDLFCLPNLIFLDLSHNMLSELPIGVCNLQQLQLLFLSANRLTTIPWHYLSALSHLTAFHLDKNKLQSICWRGGPALLDMDVSRNRLQQVCVTNCPTLHTLNLARNELTPYGLHLKGVPHIQNLDLCKNKLTSLPPCTTDLLSLKRLDLGHNQIPQLSPAITALSGLSELTLKDNLLLELPDLLAALQGLTCLDVASNPIVSVSPLLNRLTNLKQLNMRHISIETDSLLPLCVSDPSPSADSPSCSSPHSQHPHIPVSHDSSSLTHADLADEACSQPALPLPPFDDSLDTVSLPPEITRTVLEDITAINATAYMSGIQRDLLEEFIDTPHTRDTNPDSREGTPSSTVLGTVQGELGSISLPRIKTTTYSSSHAGCALYMDLVRHAGEMTATYLGEGSSTVRLEGECSTTRVPQQENEKESGQAGQVLNWGLSTSVLIDPYRACPDCLGCVLATRIMPERQFYPDWSSAHDSDEESAAGVNEAFVALSRCGQGRLLGDAMAAAEVERAALEKLWKGKGRCEVGDAQGGSITSPPCTACSARYQQVLSVNATDSSCVDVAKLPPPCCTHPYCSSRNPSSSPPPAPLSHFSCWPRPSTFKDMHEWGESSVWLLLLQLFQLGGYLDVPSDSRPEWTPMPLPHALISLEINNPSCKVRVDREVGTLIARVLAKVTRTAAQFMHSLERHSRPLGSQQGSFLHSPEFGLRLKSGYGALLRLVRRHCGLRLETLDLEVE